MKSHKTRTHRKSVRGSRVWLVFLLPILIPLLIVLIGGVVGASEIFATSFEVGEGFSDEWSQSNGADNRCYEDCGRFANHSFANEEEGN